MPRFKAAPKMPGASTATRGPESGAFLPPTEQFAAETAKMLAPSESHPRRQTGATPKQAKSKPTRTAKSKPKRGY